MILARAAQAQKRRSYMTSSAKTISRMKATTVTTLMS